jgi:DNA recombination protein RmuC
MSEALFLALGLVLGALLAFAAARPQLARLRRQQESERDEVRELERTVTELQTTLVHERRTAAERSGVRDEFADAFKALSAEALRELQRESRVDLEQRRLSVERLIEPITKGLDKVERETRELEKARGEAYGALSQQLQSLASTQERLRTETASLVTALRAPAVRGRWGEIQLRRVVEAAGMLPYCDFDEQPATVADGRTLRPDLVVRLPGAKSVVVDAKTPLAAYLEALEATDADVQRTHLRTHARQLREHVTKLSAKGYWEQLDSTPDFIVLFVPADPFFAAALDQDPSLQEDAWRHRVVLATPSTLIGLLFVVAYGWRQEKVAESARAISELGKELYDRVRTLGQNFAKLGRSLEGAVGAYNETLGSLERRVLVSLRRFEELGVATGAEIGPLEPVERAVRTTQSPELELGSITEPRPLSRPDERSGDDVADAA